MQAGEYNKDFRDLLATFNAEGVKYLIIGGYAFARYAKPRATKDLDVWVEASAANAPRVFRALAKFGAPEGHFTQNDFLEPGCTLQIGIEPNRIDVLTQIGGITFRKAWPKRQQGNVGDILVWYIGHEDLIASKQAAGRMQDQADVSVLVSYLASGAKEVKRRVNAKHHHRDDAR